MKRISLALLLLLAAAGAQSQTHTLTCTSSQACVAWNASRGWSDGTAFTPGTVVNYVVYGSLENQPPVIRATTTALEVRIVGLPPGKYFFFVRCVVNGVESINSNIASKVVRFPGPTDGKIESPTDGAIESK